MGYTTKFKGEFEITPYPSAELMEMINFLRQIDTMRKNVLVYGVNGLLILMVDCYGTVGRNFIITLNGYNI